MAGKDLRFSRSWIPVQIEHGEKKSRRGSDIGDGGGGGVASQDITVATSTYP